MLDINVVQISKHSGLSEHIQTEYCQEHTTQTSSHAPDFLLRKFYRSSSCHGQ